VQEIFVVEDDIALSNGIAMALRNDQIHVAQCYSLLAARWS
jgi:DNA-binding response OmpR family regulator